MLIDAIADHLEAQGVGTVTESIFVGFLPASPDTCLVLFSTGGVPPDTWLPYDNPSFQIRVRGTDPKEAYDLAMDAYGVLHGLHDITLDGIPVVDVQALQSSPVAIGRDEQGRHEYTMNYRARAQNITNHRS